MERGQVETVLKERVEGIKRAYKSPAVRSFDVLSWLDAWSDVRKLTEAAQFEVDVLIAMRDHLKPLWESLEHHYEDMHSA